MKKLAIALVVLVAIVAGGLYWAYNSLDVIVRFALEHYGPDVTGVSVRVAEVKLSPRDGKGMLRGLEIGNPSGFGAAHAARFGEIRVAVDPTTIRNPLVVIREIAVESPQITYERAGKGTNLDAIQQRIQSYAAKSEAEGAGGDTLGVRRKFVIDRLTIRGAKVTMTNPALRGQGLTFDLPDIELTDVGKRKGGVTGSEAAHIVAATLMAKISQKVLTNIDLLRKGGVEGAVDALKGLIR